MRTRTLLWWGIGLCGAALVLGAVLVFGAGGTTGFDVWWNELVMANRTEWMVSFALVLNTIGGGVVAIFVVPLLVVLILLLARQWRAAVFAVVAFLLSAGAIQLLKNLFGRARPDDMIVASDFGSFPSGHAANAATIAVVLFVVFPRLWVAVIGAVWVVAMALSRTFLSVHWVTDTLGGALLGAGVVLVLAALLLPWVRAQRRAAAVPPMG